MELKAHGLKVEHIASLLTNLEAFFWGEKNVDQRFIQSPIADDYSFLFVLPNREGMIDYRRQMKQTREIKQVV